MAQDELQEELAMMDALLERLRGLLTDVAYALKGPPAAGIRHDWSDLPELAQKLATEHKHLKAWWGEHMERVAAGFDAVADNLDHVRTEAELAGYRRGVMETLRHMEGRIREVSEPDVVVPELLP